MNDKHYSLTETFTVTSISREDLTHPVVGFTVSEASSVTDEQMRIIASKLGNNYSNQILKSSIRKATDLVINKK